MLQILPGNGFLAIIQPDDKHTLTLKLNCEPDVSGWLLTYDGDKPHIGSVSHADLGSKILAQVIGAARREMLYLNL